MISILDRAAQCARSRRSVDRLEVWIPLLACHFESALLIYPLRGVIADEHADVGDFRLAGAAEVEDRFNKAFAESPPAEIRPGRDVLNNPGAGNVFGEHVHDRPGALEPGGRLFLASTHGLIGFHAGKAQRWTAELILEVSRESRRWSPINFSDQER